MKTGIFALVVAALLGLAPVLYAQGQAPSNPTAPGTAPSVETPQQATAPTVDKEGFYTRVDSELKAFKDEISKLSTQEKTAPKAEKKALKKKEREIRKEVRAIEGKLRHLKKQKKADKWDAIKQEIEKSIEKVRTDLTKAETR